MNTLISPGVSVNESHTCGHNPQVDWVQDIADMHTKYGFNEAIRKMDKSTLAAMLKFRLDFLKEELTEAYEAKSADDIVDAMIDLIVVAIGTLDAYDVNAYEAWNRVHVANMNKQVGIKVGRPNPLGLPDLVKPPGWTAPTHVDNVGLLNKVFNDQTN